MLQVDAERQEFIERALARKNLDAFVCATPTNVLLLTGYWPVIGKSVAVATRDGALEVIIPEDEEELAEGCRARILTYLPSRLDKLVTLKDALAEPLSSVFKRLNLSGAKIGIETGPQLIPAAYVSIHVFNCELSEILCDLHGSPNLASADAVLAYLRSHLSPLEVERLRVACDISKMSFDHVPDHLSPGISEADVAAKLTRLLSDSIGYRGVRRAGGEIFCMSGPNAAKASAAFQISTTRHLQEGDLVLIHCNSYADGFWTDITRTYTVGDAGDRAKQLFGAIELARRAALQAVRPGAKASDVDAAARSVMSDQGLGKEFTHGLGHGVGFVAIDHDAIPRLSPNSPDIIEEGMAFNLEPGAYFRGWGGARHCDMVLCTNEGSQLLTEF